MLIYNEIHAAYLAVYLADTWQNLVLISLCIYCQQSLVIQSFSSILDIVLYLESGQSNSLMNN